MNFENCGIIPNHDNYPGIPARVTAVHKERYQVVCARGETYARLKTREYYLEDETFPTTGDFVMIDYIENGDSRILATLPRRTYFSRRDPDKGRGEQAVAANFDYVFLMQSLNQDFNPKRLERYLTQTWQSGATPVVVLTKADLAIDYTNYLREVERVAAGVEIHVVSARTGYGLEGLTPYLAPGKTLVLLGSSGVGKSSLVNALAGKEVMAAGEIRADDDKGRHTTTHRQMLMLPNDCMVIDTPGMRELGIWGSAEGLNEAFSDVERFLGRCRFRDCSHTREPGCAIRAAIESGELDSARWESYQKLKNESDDSESRAELLQRKQHWRMEVSKEKKRLGKTRPGKY